VYTHPCKYDRAPAKPCAPTTLVGRDRSLQPRRAHRSVLAASRSARRALPACGCRPTAAARLSRDLAAERRTVNLATAGPRA
jgi:hypothetical protein